MKFARVFLMSILAGSLVVVSGCATSNQLVPKSVIHVTDSTGKKLSVELPKDMKAEAIDFIRNPDGELSFSIKNIEVRTSPEVIGAAGVAQTDAIKAGGEVAIEGFKLGLDAAKTAAVPK